MLWESSCVLLSGKTSSLSSSPQALPTCCHVPPAIPWQGPLGGCEGQREGLCHSFPNGIASNPLHCLQEPCPQHQAVASSWPLCLQEAASHLGQWGCMFLLILPKPGSGFGYGVVQPCHMCRDLGLHLQRTTLRPNRRLNTRNTANMPKLKSSPESSGCYFFTHPCYICITCAFLSSVPALKLVARRGH